MPNWKRSRGADLPSESGGDKDSLGIGEIDKGIGSSKQGIETRVDRSRPSTPRFPAMHIAQSCKTVDRDGHLGGGWNHHADIDDRLGCQPWDGCAAHMLDGRR